MHINSAVVATFWRCRNGHMFQAGGMKARAQKGFRPEKNSARAEIGDFGLIFATHNTAI
jgi:hypothetical protein